MPKTLAGVIAHVRAHNKPQSHNAILLAEIARLSAALAEIANLPDEENEWDGTDLFDKARSIARGALSGNAGVDFRAAIQTHHDTKYGLARSAAVIAPPDQALYAAAGIKHRTLDGETLDAIRRAPARGNTSG